jgi:hypothetical protein
MDNLYIKPGKCSIEEHEDIENTELIDIWLEWHVEKNLDDSLISFDFCVIKKNFSDAKSQKLAIPLMALYHLAEKYNWLQVLRGPDHRPKDPYELVRFIKILDSL